MRIKLFQPDGYIVMDVAWEVLRTRMPLERCVPTERLTTPAEYERTGMPSIQDYEKQRYIPVRLAFQRREGRYKPYIGYMPGDPDPWPNTHLSWYYFREDMVNPPDHVIHHDYHLKPEWEHLIQWVAGRSGGYEVSDPEILPYRRSDWT